MKNEISRPDPDRLLAQIQEDNAPEKKQGRLKIFLGYVAGVGKTYAMLEAAHQRKDEGVDVIVGYIETHGRKETEELLSGLEVLPRQKIDYRGVQLTEMDLDQALHRQPKLILVDELAHTNAPGSRHLKRYKDVEELLNAGIDVYTTINIQHLESLNDNIFQITGVKVRETIPDRILDDAYEIELVDLPSDELIQRLKNGKVYVPEQASRAIEKFFRKGNLTALREMAMRRAAVRVDSQMRSYMQSQDIPGPWAAGERILVSLSSHPLGERLIRAGRKLADELNAEWFVLFVETPQHLHMPEQNQKRIQHNMALAEQLGAHVFFEYGNSVTDVVMNFCHQQNITKIVAGRAYRPRWKEYFKNSVIDEIIRRSGRIDVYVVSDDQNSLEHIQPQVHFKMNRDLMRYLGSIGLVGIATLISLLIHPALDTTNLVMIYLAAVVLSAVYLGRGPSIFASILSVLVFDFFLVDPKLSFTVNDTQYLITFTGLLVVGLIISTFASLLKDQVETLRERETQTQATNRFSQELTAAVTLEQVMDITSRYFSSVFLCDVAVLLPENDELVVKMVSPQFQLDESEMAVARWVYKNEQAAGSGTTTLPSAKARFIPLITSHGVVSVIGLKPNNSQELLIREQKGFMSSFTNLAAIAIERARFAEDALQTATLRAAERLQSALLNSISHQIRTPLATIQGVLTGLLISEKDNDRSAKFDLNARIELLESGTSQVNQLNRLVANLLDMTRLDAGIIHLNCEPSDIQDLVGAVIDQMADTLLPYQVVVNIPPDIPAVFMDVILTGQVLTNIFENASKYSEKGSKIEIGIETKEDRILVSISDEGVGIPEGDLTKVFEKFYRVERPGMVTGTGLGLSICKGIVEAQKGKIWAENNNTRGVTIHFTIPFFETFRQET